MNGLGGRNLANKNQCKKTLCHRRHTYHRIKKNIYPGKEMIYSFTPESFVLPSVYKIYLQVKTQALSIKAKSQFKPDLKFSPAQRVIVRNIVSSVTKLSQNKNKIFHGKVIVYSGLFKGRRGRHLPRAPLLWDHPLRCYVYKFSFFFGEKRLIHSYNVLQRKSIVSTLLSKGSSTETVMYRYFTFKGVINSNCNGKVA